MLQGRITRKEVPHGSVYRAPAPLPDLPAPAAAPPPGPNSASTPSSPRPLVQQVLKEEGASWKRVFYTPWLTFWAFFWQALEPRSLLPRRRQADRRLDGPAGPGARRRGHQPVLQGPGAAARSGPVPLDALAGPRAARRGARGVAVVRPPGQGGRRHDGEHARHRGQPARSTRRARRRSPGWASRSPGWWSSSAWPPAVVLEAAIGKYQGKQTGENALFRRLWDEIPAGRRVAGGPLLRLVLRHRAVEAAGRGQRVPAAPAAGHRLPPGPAAGQGGSHRDLGQAGAPRLDGRGDL